MSCRTLAALALFAAGCLEGRLAQSLRPPAGPAANPPAPQPAASRAPATEAAGRRVIAVSRKLLDANPALGARPVFLTLGAPQPEIFHQGGGLRPYQVFISEGLVNRCQGDDQLAAVLAVQLGRLGAELAAARAPARDGEAALPPAPRLGNDDSATHGSADGTRRMEAAKFARPRGGRAPPPRPEALAKLYLSRAGYPEAALAAVAPLLREAEDHDRLEGQFRASPR